MQERAFGLVAIVALHAFQNEPTAFFDLVGCIHMREDWHSLLGPIGISEHGMPLPVLVNHKFYWLIRDLFDFGVQRFRQNVSRAADL